MVLEKLNYYTDEYAELVKICFENEQIVLTAKKNTNGNGYLDGTVINTWLENGYYLYTAKDDNGEIIGGAVLSVAEEENASGIKIEKIFVKPDLREKGFGQEIYKQIESNFIDADFFTCDCPMTSRRDHNFLLNKCDMRATKISSVKKLKDAVYVMRKNIIKSV